MFDTGQAARVLNMARHSLAHLLQVYCQVEADKQYQLADWRISYVLPNHMLLQISEILPRERQGVLACCNPYTSLVRQYLIEIHNIIMEAREVPLTTVSTPKIKEPSMYKHPKYNPDSLLNCTHDMSYQQKYQDLGNTPCLLDPKLLKENPTMFGNKTKDGKHEQVFNNWMLMKHTAVKRKETPPTPATSSGPPAAKRQKVEVKDTGDLLQPFGKLKSGHGRILGKDTDIETSRKKKKKRKMEEEGELQLEEEEEEEPAEEFTPYDYSKVNLNIFEGGTSKEGKKKVFDPNAGMRRRGRGSKVYKPQFSTAKSQKSSTFGKMDKSQRQQIWPK
ncbi:EXOSC10 [Mytilus edulis]|uniref:RRP6 n=1 Tax=Mytilus edulis TaxID=6550 RepID=A0A8S3UQB4_MYTED|nr:EXOSC10 [Mytilus edulis]